MLLSDYIAQVQFLLHDQANADFSPTELIAAINNGFSVKDQERIVLATVGAYRSAIRDFASMNNLEVWYAHMDVETAVAELGSQVKPKMAKRTEKTLAKARTRDSMSAFSKLTERVDGHVRIVDQAPLLHHVGQPVGQPGRGRCAVPPGPPGLLVIALH